MYPAKKVATTMAIAASKRLIVLNLTLKSFTLKSIHIPQKIFYKKFFFK
jgi:hypothetical protein